MTDKINAWQQSGVLHLWRYKPEKSGLKGWHLAADARGFDSLIDLLELMVVAGHPCKRTLSLSEPSARIANGPFSPLGARKVIAPHSVQIMSDTEETGDHWHIEEQGARLVLHLGTASVVELLGGLRRRVRKGYGDDCVGPTRGDRPQNIWFW